MNENEIYTYTYALVIFGTNAQTKKILLSTNGSHACSPSYLGLRFEVSPGEIV
jgi:hypothetical protein